MDKIIEWFGEDRLRENEERINRFWQGEERFIVSIQCGKDWWYRINRDEPYVMKRAISNLECQSNLPGLYVPAFPADFGTVTMARYFGGQARYDSLGSNIFIDPIADTIEQALELKVYPIDHPDMNAIKGINFYNKLCKELNTKNLWFRFPDGQGVLNATGSILRQDELFTRMYTDPDKVHQLLNKVTGFIVEYYKYFYTNVDKVLGSIWPPCYFPREICSTVTEDMMPLMPADLYKEFAVPFLKRMNKEFGSLQIHCCGEWAQHIDTYLNCGIDVKAMEFHYPYTKIEQLEPLWDKVVFIPYILLEKQNDFKNYGEYFEFLKKNFSNKARFYFSFLEDTPDAIEFAKQYGF